MSMLATLQKQLTDIGQRRARQAKVVEDIEAPRRELARLEADEAAQQAELARIETRISEARDELTFVTDLLAIWVPLIPDLEAARRVFAQLDRQGAFDYATAAGNFQSGDFNRMWLAFGQQLEIIEAHKERAKRLHAELKTLGGA